MLIGGGGGGFGVPPGDPATLRQAAAALSTSAGLVADIGTRVGSTARSVVADAAWQGGAADAFSARADRLATQITRIESPLKAIASAIQVYASALEAAQQQAQAAASAGAAVGSLAPKDQAQALTAASNASSAAWTAYLQAAATATAAVRAAIGALPDRTDHPPVPVEAAAGESTPPSLYELADQINSKIGLALSPVVGALTGPEVNAWRVALQAWEAGRALPGGLQTAFDDIVGPVGLAFDRGEVGLEAFGPVLARYGNLADAATSFTDGFVTSALDGLKSGGMPDAGFLGVAGKVFAGLGVFSDALTLYNPGASGAEGNVNRGMAGANIIGTGMAFAPEAAGLVGINMAADWVPVAGQVVMAATGLYLAGDWAYHNVSWFHDGVDATGHFFATDVPNFVTQDVPHVFSSDIPHAAGDVGQFFAHSLPDAAGGAAQDVSHFITHDLNPLNW